MSMEMRSKSDTRDSMRPDPKTLAATYRLNLLPKKKNFVLVKKTRRNAGSSSKAKSTENTPRFSLDVTKELLEEEEAQAEPAKPAVYIRTSCWKIDEGTEDESDDEDYEDDLRPDSVHSETKDQSQHTYTMMCKTLCVQPLKVFRDGLIKDTVAVCHMTLNPDDIKACVTALVHTDNVEKVIFDGNNMGPLGAARLADILPQKFEFRELTIKNNKMGTEGAAILCKALLNNNSIRKLDLSGNDFCEDDGEIFGELLEENGALREVNLSHNNFRCRGGQMIAEGLAKNRFLKKLDLSWNHLRMEGAQALGKSLIENSDLEELSLAWNGFHLRGCMALGEALRHNASLLSLDLTCNRISELCLAQILKGLKDNSSLLCLKLPLNPLSPQSAYSILQFIDKHENIALNHVDLGDQCVYEEFKNFLKEIQKSRDLTVIHGPILRTGLCIDNGTVQQEEELKEEGSTMDENPLIVLMEFCRLQNLRLIDMFNNIDKDRSKSLTYDEFKQGLERVNIPLSEDSLKSLVKYLDANSDGSIDFSELIDGQKEYKRLVQDALREGPLDSSVIGEIGIRMKQHIKKQYLHRKTF